MSALCRERSRAIQPLTGLPLPPRGIRTGSGVMRNTLIALWSGDFPLGQAFWHYAIAYGTIANILATAAAIAAVLTGLPDAVAIGLHFLPLPYVVMAVVGVWRSADKYRGDPTWAGIAKAAVIVWGALMVFV